MPKNPAKALRDCKTLMLDMDGTLLDLAYDNYMWLEHIPAEFARQNEVSEATARERLKAKFRSMEGKLSWYCLDHWSEELDLDIAALHRDENNRIGFLPGARRFLETVVGHDLRLLLVTNSHQETLTIKTEVTGVTDFFHGIYTHALQEAEGFDTETTLFVDDNVAVLESAKEFGVGMLLHITRPDTRWPAREDERFTAIEGVVDLLG